MAPARISEPTTVRNPGEPESGLFCRDIMVFPRNRGGSHDGAAGTDLGPSPLPGDVNRLERVSVEIGWCSGAATIRLKERSEKKYPYMVTGFFRT